MKKIIKYIVYIAATLGIIAILAVNLPKEKGDSVDVYTVKDYNGRIGVFVNDSEIPSSTLDVFVNSLPIADRNDLEKGITVYSQQELSRLIEDLDG